MKRLFKSIGWKLFPYLDLNLKTPQRRYRLPLRSRHSFPTLQEIFIHRCYQPLLAKIPALDSWVDVGCNVGFFSLFVTDHFGIESKSAVLVDANPECVQHAMEVVAQNRWQAHWSVKNAVIGKEGEQVSFMFRQAATRSSAFETNERGVRHTFVCQSLKTILSQSGFSGRDLIKIDIEGGEKFLFESESALLLEFKYGIIEWHAPHWTGLQLKNWAENNKLKLTASSSNPDIWKEASGVAFWSRV